MSTMDTKTLRRLRDKLRADSERLVVGTHVDLARDDGTTTRQRIPGLITQLQAAIGNSGERKRVIRRKRGLPIVISVQAFDIMSNIDRTTKQWSKARAIPHRITLKVADLCTRSTDAIGDMHYVSRYLDSWVRLITELFDPPKRIHLAAPCPECRETTVRLYHMDDAEYVLTPALQIIKTGNGHECECFSCGTVWPDSSFLLLAKILGCESLV